MRSGRWAALGGVGLLMVLGGCASLTPAQSEGLSKAQRLVDDVTSAYGAPRVRVIADRDNVEGYGQRSDWITFRPDTLTNENLLVLTAMTLPPATMLYEPVTDWGTVIGHARLRRQRLDFNRRGVEILVRFLGDDHARCGQAVR